MRSWGELNSHEQKSFAAQGMRKHGGGFCRAIGRALTHADPNNTMKIKASWNEWWNDYGEIEYIKFLEEEKLYV